MGTLKRGGNRRSLVPEKDDMRKTPDKGFRLGPRLVMTGLLVGSLVTGLAQSSPAQDIKETEQILNRAATTWEDFMKDQDLSGFRNHVKEAKGVLIFPQLLKGAFLFGIEGGNGVLFVRDEKPGPGVNRPFMRRQPPVSGCRRARRALNRFSSFKPSRASTAS
jgi:hypothetical protein